MDKIYKNKEKFYNILIISGIIVVVLAVYLIAMLSLSFEFFFIIIAFYITIMIVVYHEMVKKPFKLEVVGKILKEYKNTIEYTYRDKMIDVRDMIKELKLIPSASTFNFTDIIKDEIEGVNYRSMELHATHTTSNGKTTTTVTDFLGKAFEIDLKADFSYVLKEEKWKHVPKGYEFMELEVIDFNSKFNLYTDNNHEIFKVFTPSKIKNMLELEKKHENVMMIVQKTDKLYILLHDNENLFEDMNNPKFKIIENYKKQVELLKDYLSVINN